jgi:hypothetical protein
MTTATTTTTTATITTTSTTATITTTSITTTTTTTATPPTATTITTSTVSTKGKWSCYRPSVAQRVGRGITLLFHDRGTRSGWVVSTTCRLHFIPRKDPVPILQEAGWAPGPVWTGGKSRPHRHLIPDHPAQSVAIPTELPGTHTITTTTTNTVTYYYYYFYHYYYYDYYYNYYYYYYLLLLLLLLLLLHHHHYYYYYMWVLIFISNIFKNVLLATRKSHGGINYELVMQAKTRPKPVSAVHYFAHLTHTPNCHHLTDCHSDGSRVRLKLTSNQVTLKHPHHIINTDFYIFFKLCGLVSDLLAHYGPQAPMILTCLCRARGNW